MTKRMLALCIAVLGVAALLPAAAGAATFNSSTNIAINSQGNGFKGTVTSPKPTCKSGRHVSLQREKQGQTSFTPVGSDTTSSAGAWNITSNPINGAKYRAVVTTKSGGGTTCKAAISLTTIAHSTSSTIVQGANNFHGKVSSPSNSCVANRAVALQRKTIYQSQFNTIGTDLTDSAGNWLVPTTPVSGAQYRAQVAPKQVGTNSCMKAFSPVKTAT
jgi:hypothetical protein